MEALATDSASDCLILVVLILAVELMWLSASRPLGAATRLSQLVPLKYLKAPIGCLVVKEGTRHNASGGQVEGVGRGNDDAVFIDGKLGFTSHVYVKILAYCPVLAES